MLFYFYFYFYFVFTGKIDSCVFLCERRDVLLTAQNSAQGRDFNLFRYVPSATNAHSKQLCKLKNPFANVPPKECTTCNQTTLNIDKDSKPDEPKWLRWLRVAEVIINHCAARVVEDG